MMRDLRERLNKWINKSPLPPLFQRGEPSAHFENEHPSACLVQKEVTAIPPFEKGGVGGIFNPTDKKTKPAMSTLINIQNLSKQYQSKTHTTPVLQDITLTIQHGEFMALTGSSGSGKSTLLNIIGLLDTPTGGTYQLNQTHITSCRDEALAALRNQYFGFVFQQFNLLPRLRVDQNVAMPLFYRQTPEEEIQEHVLCALEKVGLRTLHDRLPNQLSGGQQQRVAIARALVGAPEVILADEPTGALDSKTGGAIFDVFLSLHAEGKTILLVTHDQTLAHRCQRQIVMTDGRLQEECT